MNTNNAPLNETDQTELTEALNDLFEVLESPFDGHDELNEHTHEANVEHLLGIVDRTRAICLKIIKGE